MIAAFLFAFQQVPQPINEGIVGAFRHGAWDGICWRDGNLAGRPQEECRAWWHRNASIELELERTVAATYFFASSVRSGKTCSSSIAVPTSGLRSPERARQITRRLAILLQRQASKCQLPSPDGTLNVAEVGAVLRETDGLEKLDL